MKPRRTLNIFDKIILFILGKRTDQFYYWEFMKSRIVPYALVNDRLQDGHYTLYSRIFGFKYLSFTVNIENFYKKVAVDVHFGLLGYFVHLRAKPYHDLTSNITISIDKDINVPGHWRYVA